MPRFRSFLAKRIEYQITVFSLSTFSIPTILRFPDLALKYGVGKFLSVFICLSFLLILPLLILEYFFFDRRVRKNFSFARPVTQLKAWRSWPLGRIIGVCQFILGMLLLVYYSTLLWPVLLFASVSTRAPWAACNQNWSQKIVEETIDFTDKTEHTAVIPGAVRRALSMPGTVAATAQALIQPDPTYCYYGNSSEQVAGLNNSLYFYQTVINRDLCGDPDKATGYLMVIFISVIAVTLTFCASLQVRGAAWFGALTAPMTFASFGFLLFRAITLPGTTPRLLKRLTSDMFTLEDFATIPKIQQNLLTSGIVSAALGQGLLQLNAAALGIAGSWRSSIAPSTIDGKQRRSAPICDLVWDCLGMYFMTTVGALTVTAIVCLLLPVETDFSAQFLNGYTDAVTANRYFLMSKESSDAAGLANNMPGMSIAVILSLVNFIPFEDSKWSVATTVQFYSVLISTLLLVQCAMTLLPIMNTMHTVIVQLLGAQANTCTKDGQSPEEIMARARPNKCLGKIFGSCAARYTARLITAILLATISLGICVGFPCFFGSFFVIVIRIFDDYILPTALSTMTLAILIGIFIPITQILASHKERTSDRLSDGILPILAIIVLCLAILPALLAFASSLLYLTKSSLVQSYYKSIVRGREGAEDDSQPSFSVFKTENLVLFVLMITVPALLILLMITVPCVAGCMQTYTKLRRKSKVLAASKVNSSAPSTAQRPSAYIKGDRYDTIAEDPIVLQHLNGPVPPGHAHIGNYDSLHNESSSAALTYSSSNPELGQSCLTIFFKSLKNAFIPARETGVSDNIIASGQSYHTLDRQHQLIPEQMLFDEAEAAVTLQFTTTV